MAQQRRRTGRRPPARQKSFLSQLAQLLRPKAPDFKPDSEETSILHKLHMTQLQRLTLLRWTLYVLTCIVMLVIQDVIMSHFSFLGATTDLVVCVILLITIMEGTEVGSLFVFLASILYYFSGSSPGPYCVVLLTFVGIGATMFRQFYWHWNISSILRGGGAALVLYELGTFATGLFLKLTHWGRLGIFLVTALLSWIAMIPLFYLINLIGQIGGHTWKE